MKLAIVTITFVLFGIVATWFYLRLRRIERAGGTLGATRAQKLMFRSVPGAVIGNVTGQWFYYEVGIKNTLLSSAPFSRQLADIVGIAAFTIAGFAISEGIQKIYRLRSAGSLMPKPNFRDTIR